MSQSACPYAGKNGPLIRHDTCVEIPPRLMFLTQTIAALVACFVVVGVQNWMFGNIPGICESDQPGR